MRILLLIWFGLLAAGVFAQDSADSLAYPDITLRTDSVLVARADSLQRLDSLKADSLSSAPPPIRDTLRPALQYPFTSDSFLYRKRLFFAFKDPVRYTISKKAHEQKETVFYTVIGLLVFFALIKNAFSRYLSDLYSSYFRTTVRQKQIKEQLLQSPLPSLLFNIFFLLSTSVFLSLLAERFGYGGNAPFLLLVLYAAVGIAVVYMGKFLILKFLGWVFQLSETASTYLFIVFSTNKIMGVALLPITVLLAFGYGALSAAGITIGIVIILGLFAYRFFLAFLSIGAEVRMNAFHFLLYLAAFEILPLLLINKLLFTFLQEIT